MTNDDSTEDDSKKLDLAKGDSTDDRSDRRRRRAERAEAMRKERERAERRRRVLISGSIIVAAVLIVGVGAFAVKKANDNRVANEPQKSVITPTGTVDSAVKVTPASGKTLAKGAPTVQVYEDFLCPYCEQFETANSTYLQNLANEGKIELSYRPLAILDASKTDHYSSRASSAAMCAFEAGGEANFLKAHNALYGDQPSESASSFPTNSALYKTLVKGGVTGLTKSCLTKEKYAPWALSISKATYKGSTAYLKKWPKLEASTPTVLVNDKEVSAMTNAQMKAAIAKAES